MGILAVRNLLRAVARRVALGFAIPRTSYRLRLLVERDVGNSDNAHSDSACSASPALAVQSSNTTDLSLDIINEHIETVLRLCPDLKVFSHAAVHSDLGSATAFLTFCNNMVALFAPQAHEVHTRRQLTELANRVTDLEFSHHIRRMIAMSDLKSGVVERAHLLRDDPVYSNDYARQKLDFDTHYAAIPPFLGQTRDQLDLDGDLRGRCLVWFYTNNPQLIRHKRILHVAPEQTLETWFRAHAIEMGLHYETLDGFGGGVDHISDLTSLPFSDGSYDVIICHRVLEHILDDRKALSEMNRVLAEGGLIDLSVPESPHLPQSNEWIIQDSPHHDHVRQYGRDLPDRIEESGFIVEVDSTLLQRSLEDHLKDKTYPLRHYICRVHRSNLSNKVS